MATAAISEGLTRPAHEAHTVNASVAVSAFASIGAGAIHAAAIGVHSEHRQAVIAFSLLAIAQIGFGVVALVNSSRLLLGGGIMVNAAAIGGWLLAKTSGIGFIDGLDAAEDPQFADSVAAALALVAVAGAVWALLMWRRAVPMLGATALFIVAVVTALIATPAMVNAGSHSHAGGHGGASGDGHAHGGEAAAAAGHEDGEEHAEGEAHAEGEVHEAAVVPPKPYDPNGPIDLGGIEGVTPEQQARAENLIAQTLADLPHYADPAAAEAAGYRSIGDGLTGYEHYINFEYMEDGRVLDSDYPESLVYQTRGASGKQLVAAMYMAEPGTTLDNTPELGGKLTQWHIHNNLCFTTEGRVAGLTNADGSCNPPLVKGTQAPMIHVWITPHPCGPFAALEGIAGGQVPEGEERLCDTAHGH